MRFSTKNNILYLGSWLASILFILILNHRDFAEGLNYRVKATDISVILYTSFIFGFPLLLKFLLNEITKKISFAKLFNFQFIISWIQIITIIAIILSPSTVNPEDNFSIDRSGNLYLFEVFLKFLQILLNSLLFIVTVFKIVKTKLNKKYSL